jgi:hypothetical protein
MCSSWNIDAFAYGWYKVWVFIIIYLLFGRRTSLGNYDGAVSDCNKVLEINPQSARAYGRLGSAQLKVFVCVWCVCVSTHITIRTHTHTQPLALLSH